MPYFIRVKGKAFGPFDETQILDMKTKGKVSRTTEISGDKLNWQHAETYSWLFEPQRQDFVSASPPPSGTNGGEPKDWSYTLPSRSKQETLGTNGGEPKDWFYSTNGKEGYGPVPADSIRQMLLSGQLNLNSYVWQDGQNARFVKDEPMFAPRYPGGASSPPSSSGIRNDLPQSYSAAGVAGGGNAAADNWNAALLFVPLKDSLGWLMFLKIFFLIILIMSALGLFIGGVFCISKAVGAERSDWLAFTLLDMLISAGLLTLLFISFLKLWNYHTDLQRAAQSEKQSDLEQACRNLFLYWKWSGIFLIAFTSVWLVSFTLILIIYGNEIGKILRML